MAWLVNVWTSMPIRYNFELELWISIVLVLDSIRREKFELWQNKKEKCNQVVR
jgi:hypothetical protein